MMRKVFMIPYSAHKAIHYKGYVKMCRHICRQMRNLRWYGSRFANFHFRRMVNEGKNINTLKATKIRQIFVALDKHARVKDEEVQESLRLWKEKFGVKEYFSIAGLNTITTKVWEEYHVGLQQHQTYTVADHLGRFLRWKHKKLSTKESVMIANHVFAELKLATPPSYKDSTLSSFEAIIESTKTWISSIIRDDESLVLLHYKILQELAEIEDAPLFHLTPLCSTKNAFFELSVKALSDLHKAVESGLKKNICVFGLSINEMKGVQKRGALTIEQFLDDEGVRRKSMKRIEYDYGPTIITDGYQLQIPWQHYATFHKKYTAEEYEERGIKQEQYDEKKLLNALKRKEDGKKPDIRASRKREPKIVSKEIIYQSKSSFTYASCGLFHSSSTLLSTIKPGTKIVVIDPGHINPIMSVMTKWGSGDIALHRQITLGEYYHGIGNKKFVRYNNQKGKVKKVKEALEELAQHSLKTADFDTFVENMKVNLRIAPLMFQTYGTGNHSRERFRKLQTMQSYFDRFVDLIAPGEDTIVVVGDAKFAHTRVGLSATPIFKMIAKLSKHRRVIVCPEHCTTKRCSACRDSKADTKSAYSSRIITSKRTGKAYHPKIHGLRHCEQCHRTWNRDLNAARNIFFMFENLMLKRSKASYLDKKQKDPIQREASGSRLVEDCGSKEHITQSTSNEVKEGCLYSVLGGVQNKM